MSDVVTNGAAFLDTYAPSWHMRIDPSILEIRMPATCILGQLFGDYLVGLSVLRLSGDEASEYGFDIHDDQKWLNREYTNPLWMELDERWRSEIAARSIHYAHAD